MYLRPKTKRRLVVLLSCAALILGGLGALVGMQLHRIEVRQMQDRALAMDAYGRGDYTTAMRWFRRYLAHTDDDAEAIYAYADCRLHVPGADLGYLIEAKSIFYRYLELRPGDLLAQHQLLKIYRDLGYEDDAYALALTILKENDDDLPALDEQVYGLIAQSKYDQALVLSQKRNDLEPLDLPGQITTLKLMRTLHRQPQEGIDRVELLMKNHPPDARLDLLRAIAADMAGNSSDTVQWLRSATALAPNDPLIVLDAARLFQSHGNTTDAKQSLNRLAQNLAISPANRVEIAKLLLQQSEYDDAVRVLEFDRRSDSDLDRNLLLARLYSAVGRFDDADQMYRSLLSTQAESDSVKRAAAWFYATRGDIPKGRSLLAHCDDPTIAAEFEEDFGDDKTALAKYIAATKILPHSAHPWMALAGFELRTGDYSSAAKTAKQGTRSAADNAELNAMMASAQLLEKLKPGPELLPLIESLSTNPNNAAAVAALAAISDIQTHLAGASDALTRLSTIAQSNPEFLPAQSALVEQYISAGRTVDAQQIAETADRLTFIRADTGNIEALIDLAAAQTRIGRPDQAATTLDRINIILKISPEISASARARMDQVSALVKSLPQQSTSVTEVK
jgi:tetratricopeptide (TPR) repeat protein